MLADEAHDAAPVPKRPPGQKTLVGDSLVRVADDRLGDVPALPTGFRGPVAEMHVLAVEPEPGVEAAELVEHLAAEEQERGQHPLCGSGLGGAVLQEIVIEL